MGLGPSTAAWAFLSDAWGSVDEMISRDRNLHFGCKSDRKVGKLCVNQHFLVFSFLRNYFVTRHMKPKGKNVGNYSLFYFASLTAFLCIAY